MTMYGQASVWGVGPATGATPALIKLNGSATAVDAMIETIEGEHSAKIDDFMDTNEELIGFKKSDEREVVNITLIPRKTAGVNSLRDAMRSLIYPPIPSKVTVENVQDADANPKIEYNGDYLYQGGATRTMHRGQAALRLRCFKPKSSPLTVDQLITVAT